MSDFRFRVEEKSDLKNKGEKVRKNLKYRRIRGKQPKKPVETLSQ